MKIYLKIHENNQFSLKETRLREKHEYAVLGRSPNFLCQIAPSPPPQTKAMAVPSTARCLEWKGSVIWRNNRTQETHATHARNKLVQRPTRSQNTQNRVLPPKTSPIEQISYRCEPKNSNLQRVTLQSLKSCYRWSILLRESVSNRPLASAQNQTIVGLHAVG